MCVKYAGDHECSMAVEQLPHMHEPRSQTEVCRFLEVGTELNLVGKKKCTLRQNASKQGVRNTPEKKMAPVPMAVRGQNGAKNKKIARCHLVNKVYVAFLKKMAPFPMAVRGLNGAKVKISRGVIW